MNTKLNMTMNKDRDDAAGNLRRRERFRYILVIEGVFIGLMAGVLISIFRLMLIYADKIREQAAVLVRSGIGWALIWAAALLIITVAVSLLLRAEPDIAGSGIPQVEAELGGQKDMCWHRVIIAKMTGCALAIGGGLALGREGPSIQLGAMVGKGFSRWRKRLLTEERLLITCGAGAGLSAAFGAPLAGAIFTLEELHRNFSAEILLSTMAASAASDFVAANIFGLSPVFGIEAEHSLPLKHYWAVVILGLLLGLFGAGYNRTIALMQDAFDRIGVMFARLANRIPGFRAFNLTDSKLSIRGEDASRTGRLLVMFACAYILMFCFPAALGSGSRIVGEVAAGRYALGALAVLLVIKFIYSTASFGSGSPGGIFLPLLVLGAVSGGMYCRLLGTLGFEQKYITGMVIVGMAGLFAAIVRAPVTGVILITEMTGDFTCLLPLVLVSLIAYLTAEMLGVDPIYTQLLHRSRKKDAGISPDNIKPLSRERRLFLRDRKVVLDADVHVGSFMDGRSVSDFGLPMGTLIISVVRDGIEIIPDGHTILRGGDELEILTREYDVADAEALVEERCRIVQDC